MVDARPKTEQSGDAVTKLLQWLGTFKGFHNKLELKAADGESLRTLCAPQCEADGSPFCGCG